MPKLSLESRGPRQTQHIGALLGELAQGGDVFLLLGELGAGKTCLAQGVAKGLGVAGQVRSPSFILVGEHQGRLPLFHIDLYRLERIEEALALGLEEYFGSGGVCLVEWADRALSLMPEEHLMVRMRYLSPRRREIELVPEGLRYQQMVAALGRRLAQEEDQRE